MPYRPRPRPWPFAFVLCLSLSSCLTPAQTEKAIDTIEAAEKVAHLICTIAGLTDLECVKRVLFERNLAMTRASRVSDAGTE